MYWARRLEQHIHTVHVQLNVHVHVGTIVHAINMNASLGRNATAGSIITHISHCQLTTQKYIKISLE